MTFVKELMPENTILAAIPYESNPFYPGKACRQIFLKLLDGTYKEEKYKRAGISNMFNSAWEAYLDEQSRNAETETRNREE